VKRIRNQTENTINTLDTIHLNGFHQIWMLLSSPIYHQSICIIAKTLTGWNKIWSIFCSTAFVACLHESHTSMPGLVSPTCPHLYPSHACRTILAKSHEPAGSSGTVLINKYGSNAICAVRSMKMHFRSLDLFKPSRALTASRRGLYRFREDESSGNAHLNRRREAD